MRFSGKFFIFFFCSTFLFADNRFKLSKKSILKGEPLTAQFELKGGVNVRVPKNIISKDGVTAEYIGTEESVSIVNTNISRKKIVKFRIVTSKDGNLKTPDIALEIDGEEVHSGEEEFTVSKEKYVPRNNWFDFGEDIFEGRLPGFSRRAFTEPEEGDLIVKFETMRNTVFVGEPVVGYFNLYYKNIAPPFIERNEMKPLNFPYFSLDQQEQVTITAKDKIIINGDEYSVLPYQREVYVLTPLKKGVYELGESEFLLEGSPTSYFSQRPVLSQKKKLIVKDLPTPLPQGFKGEVGDYSTKLIVSSKDIHVGTPHKLKLKIFGEGSGVYFRNPLENLCQKPNSCNFDISMIGENRSRKFVKLKEGGYGFYSELEFEYSILPNAVGKLKFPEAEIIFFNPFKEIYETRPISFPDLKSKEKIPVVKENLTTTTNYLFVYIYVLLGISLAFLIFRFRDVYPSGIRNLYLSFFGFLRNLFYDLIPQSKRKFLLDKLHIPLSDPEGAELDQIIGNKKDTLLKNFLLQKGLSKEEAEFLSRLKTAQGNKKFSEILPTLTAENRQKILKIKVQIDSGGKK